jgi:hypothetical protein
VPYTDLLRLSVFVNAGAATALGAIAALSAAPDGSGPLLALAAGWWLLALVAGLILGRPSRAADGVRDVLARARTATSLPPDSPARIAFRRLWPLGLIVLVSGVAGIFFPVMPIAAAGGAMFTALAWRTHEAAVLGIEQRDGVKFYVVPNSGLRPVELVRSPGLRTDRLRAERAA